MKKLEKEIAVLILLVITSGLLTVEPTLTKEAFSAQPTHAFQLAEAIVNPSIADYLKEATYRGQDIQAQVFTEPLQGFPTEGNSYIVLSTGNAQSAPGAATDFANSDVEGEQIPGGSPEGLDAYDVATLTLVFHVPAGQVLRLSFNFKFCTEENPEYLGSEFQDYFTAIVRGGGREANIAELPDGSIVTVDKTIHLSNPVGGTSEEPEPPFPEPNDVVYNACTGTLTASVDLSFFPSEEITLELQIGDASDGNLDSAVFIDNLTITRVAPVPEEARQAAGILLQEVPIPDTSIVSFVPVQPGTEIREDLPVGVETEAAKLTVPREPGTYYAFFIDDQPGFKFAHPVRFGWLNSETKEVKLVNASWWPVIMEPGIQPRPFELVGTEIFYPASPGVLFLFGKKGCGGGGRENDINRKPDAQPPKSPYAKLALVIDAGDENKPWYKGDFADEFERDANSVARWLRDNDFHVQRISQYWGNNLPTIRYPGQDSLKTGLETILRGYANILSRSEAFQEDFETGDVSRFPWTKGGDEDWVVTDSEKHGGIYAAQAGDIDDNGKSWLQVTVNVIEDGKISFWYKVSSESDCDFLHFYIDGQEKGKWSGETGWKQVSYRVPAGTHTFKWEYTKDGSISTGQDTAWIDDISFPPMCLEFFLYIVSHGTDDGFDIYDPTGSGNEDYIRYWKVLREIGLDGWLSEFPAWVKLVIFIDTCYSGGAVKHLTAVKNRCNTRRCGVTIITSSDADHPTPAGIRWVPFAPKLDSPTEDFMDGANKDHDGDGKKGDIRDRFEQMKKESGGLNPQLFICPWQESLCSLD